MTAKILPFKRQCPDAEVQLLGAVFMSGDVLDRVADLVGPEDFADEWYGRVFGAARSLHDRGAGVDVITVAEAMGIPGNDGPASDRLLKCVESVGWTTFAADHARMIRRAATLRRLATSGLRISEIAEGAELDGADAAVSMAVDLLFQAFEDRPEDRAVSLKESMRDVAAMARERRASPRQVLGVSTGLVDLDALVRGFRPRHLYAIGARPKMGKTALAVNFAVAAGQAGHGVLYVTTEVPHEDISLRVYGRLSGVNTENIETGALTDADIEALVLAAKIASEFAGHLMIADRAAADVAYVRRHVRRYRRLPGLPPLGLVVVDHVHQMTPPRAMRNNREREVAEIGAGLLAIAKDEVVPVIALCQLNRKCEDRPNKRPTPSDLRDSGSIEQDVSVLMFLYRDEVYNEQTPDRGIAEISVPLNRKGRPGIVRVRFDSPSQRFDNLAARDDFR